MSADTGADVSTSDRKIETMNQQYFYYALLILGGVENFLFERDVVMKKEKKELETEASIYELDGRVSSAQRRCRLEFSTFWPCS